MAETWGAPWVSRGLQPRAAPSVSLPEAFPRSGSCSSRSSSYGVRAAPGLALAGVALRQLRQRLRSSKRKLVAVCGGAQYGDEFVGEEVDADLVDSLKQRTLEALDLDFILERLQGLCYTAKAAEMAVDPEALLAKSPEEARALYDTVLELTQLEDADLDLEAKLDIADEASNQERNTWKQWDWVFSSCQVDQCTRGLVLVNPSDALDVSVVLADVGDMQTIVDDLSTYSAHLVASRIMLSAAEGVGPRALVMVDEAATGTDPQQGAALARAMLESFLEMGARVVTTTHSNQLKDWAFQDERTMTAAMEYKSGRPTYRLTTNAVGESHAIETAQRLGLPTTLVLRSAESST
eukprot:Skav207633  [mRNA]  locus=scaffold1878:377646:397516:- [translate_table: standard]